MAFPCDQWPSTWFPVARRRQNPAGRLFCFPCAGGSSTDVIFREWSGAMPDDVELAVLEMPGRARRMTEPLETSLPRLIERLLPVFRACVDRPFAFFGHSLGAVVAYELARALSAARLPGPSLLMVSAKQAPHLPYARKLFDLPRDRIIGALRELNGTPDEVLRNEELLDIVLATLRSDLRMAFDYRFAGPPLREVPIMAFGGEDDPHVAVESIRAWELHTDAPFRSRIYPGGHFYMQQESRSEVRDEIVALMAALARGDGRHRSCFGDIPPGEIRERGPALAELALD